MAERPEDLNLPNAVVTRIIKDALPDGVNVSKEARLAISKAASVFVLYATSCSNNFALKNRRKTINAQDVMSAMEDMEFEQFIEPLQQCQEAFVLERKEKKKDKPAKQAVPQEATIEEEKLDENNEIEKEDDKEVEEISDEDAEKEKEASVNDVSADVSSLAVEEKSPDEEVNEESEEVE